MRARACVWMLGRRGRRLAINCKRHSARYTSHSSSENLCGFLLWTSGIEHTATTMPTCAHHSGIRDAVAKTQVPRRARTASHASDLPPNSAHLQTQNGSGSGPHRLAQKGAVRVRSGRTYRLPEGQDRVCRDCEGGKCACCSRASQSKGPSTGPTRDSLRGGEERPRRRRRCQYEG